MNSEAIGGTIVKYNDEKGFGFIESEYGKSMFFHISEYRPPNAPIVGEKIVFILGEDKQGRLQAKHVQSAEFVKKKQVERLQRQQRKAKRDAHQKEFESGQIFKLIIVVSFYLLLASLAVFTVLPWAVVIWYLVIGIATFALYANDKSAAQNNEWRTKESTLHTFAVIGGWVGAMLAHAYLRHKSQKAEFRLVYYFTVVINLLVLGYYIYSQH